MDSVVWPGSDQYRSAPFGSSLPNAGCFHLPGGGLGPQLAWRILPGLLRRGEERRGMGCWAGPQPPAPEQEGGLSTGQGM